MTLSDFFNDCMQSDPRSEKFQGWIEGVVHDRSELIECIYAGMNEEPWGQEAEMRKPDSNGGTQRLNDCGNL